VSEGENADQAQGGRAVKLHHSAQTRSMRVLWLLNELGVEFELVEHAMDGSLRSPSYLALHPAGRVPCLEVGEEVWWESGAIIELLCEHFPEGGLGRMPGQPERAEWLSWLHFSETISQHVAALTQQHVMLFDDAMRSPVVTKLEAARTGKCLDALEERLSGRDYLLDGGFSAADVAVGQAVYSAQRFHRIGERPALAAWWARIEGRPAFKAALPQPGEKLLYERDFYAPWEG